MASKFYYRAPGQSNSGDIPGLKTPPERLSLFESRARHRRIRILVDERTVPFGDDSPSDRTLRFFLDSALVQAWYVLPPFSHADDSEAADAQAVGNRIPVQELTGTLGWSEGWGLTYGYCLDDSHDCENVTVHGQFQTGRPEELLLSARLDGVEEPDNPETIENVKVASALSALANEVNADMVISEEYAGDASIRGIVDDTYYVEKNDAVSVLAHYFRTQGYFVAGVNPHQQLDADDYYTYAVYSYSPHLYHWVAKVERTVEFFGDKYGLHSVYADRVTARCSRALRRYDDLLLYLGRPLNMTTIDDSIDSVDHILVSLCAAIDTLARSIGVALGAKEKESKLHDKRWVNRIIKPIYGHVPEYARFQNCRRQIEFLFKFRNSIHSIGLTPFLEEASETASQIPKLRVLIPHTSRDAWVGMQSKEFESWGLVQWGSVVHADIHVFVRKCFETAFEFIDVLTEIISFEQVENKSQVLFENIIGPANPVHFELSSFIASVGTLTSPLLTGDYAPEKKRKLEVDEASARAREDESVLRSLGWKPRKDYTPLRQPPAITTYLNHLGWPK